VPDEVPHLTGSFWHYCASLAVIKVDGGNGHMTLPDG
jgi:hypothetical protein